MEEHQHAFSGRSSLSAPQSLEAIGPAPKRRNSIKKRVMKFISRISSGLSRVGSREIKHSSSQPEQALGVDDAPAVAFVVPATILQMDEFANIDTLVADEDHAQTPSTLDAPIFQKENDQDTNDEEGLGEEASRRSQSALNGQSRESDSRASGDIPLASPSTASSPKQTLPSSPLEDQLTSVDQVEGSQPPEERTLSPTDNEQTFAVPERRILVQDILPHFLSICSNLVTSLPEYHRLQAQDTDQALDYITSLAMCRIYDRLKQKLNKSIPQFDVDGESVYDADAVLEFITAQIGTELSQCYHSRSTYLPDVQAAVGCFGAYSVQGRRDANEDGHVSFPFLGTLLGLNLPFNISIYAVYDGHGGVECANFLKKYLHVYIGLHPLLSQGRSTLQQVLQEAFTQTQEKWKAHILKHNIPDSVGATASIAIVVDRDIFVAWVGDSFAIMFNSDSSRIVFTSPHKANVPTEQKRIYELGGFIENDRVMGLLAVTRAFGDVKYGCVVPEPEIQIHHMTGDESYLLVACDGVFESMSPLDVYRTMNFQESKSGSSPQTVCKSLVDEAFNRGSNDNITAILVHLKSRYKFIEERDGPRRSSVTDFDRQSLETICVLDEANATQRESMDSLSGKRPEYRLSKKLLTHLAESKRDEIAARPVSPSKLRDWVDLGHSSTQSITSVDSAVSTSQKDPVTTQESPKVQLFSSAKELGSMVESQRQHRTVQSGSDPKISERQEAPRKLPLSTDQVPSNSDPLLNNQSRPRLSSSRLKGDKPEDKAQRELDVLRMISMELSDTMKGD